MKKTDQHHYYLTFDEDMDIALIPVSELSRVGVWSRRSSRIYEGSSSLSIRELGDYLTGTCGLRHGRFTLLRAEDAIYTER